MTQETKYPYQHINTFVISIAVRRSSKVPPKLHLPTQISVQYTEPKFPRVQVAMKIDISEDTPISLNLEVVGLFDYIGQKKDYDKQLNREFVQERALHMLWLYCFQMVKMVSAQMGMNPLQIQNPESFHLFEEAKLESPKKSSSRKQKTRKSPA